MFHLLVIASCLLVLTQAAPQTYGASVLDGRIVGGEPTYIEEYPYQVSLLFFEDHTCGAAIISENYVLTAASCLYTNLGVPALYFSIRAGSTYYQDGGTIIQIAELHHHPNFDYYSNDYDISILELETPLTFGPGIAPVALPELNQPIVVGQLGNLTGWGSLTEESATIVPDQLYVVQVPLVSQEECAADYSSTTGVVTDRMLCAGYPQGGKDGCYGDGGGPLVIDGVLFGLVSWGSGCGRPNRPGVYASIPALRDFITEVTGL